MKSWIMQLWLGTHGKEEWPDLSVVQGIDVPYVKGEYIVVGEIEEMCSKEFYDQHRYKYVESSTNETIDFEEWIKENKNAMYANEGYSKDEPQYAETREYGVNLSRWELDPDNGGASQVPSHEFNNHERVRVRHTAHAANKASDADGNCEIHADKEEAFTTKGRINENCELNEIHHKLPAGLPKERQCQLPMKHGSAQEVRIRGREIQSSQPKKAKRVPEIEEDIHNCAVSNSGYSQIENMNANGYLENKKENASLEEACNVEPNSFEEENSGMTSWQGNVGATTESGKSDIDTTQTRKMDVDRPPVHHQQPINICKDTECRRNGETAGDGASPLRRKYAMRRMKRQNFQCTRETKCKPDNKENVCENTTLPHESQREHVYESETVLMKDERDESPLRGFWLFLCLSTLIPDSWTYPK